MVDSWQSALPQVFRGPVQSVQPLHPVRSMHLASSYDMIRSSCVLLIADESWRTQNFTKLWILPSWTCGSTNCILNLIWSVIKDTYIDTSTSTSGFWRFFLAKSISSDFRFQHTYPSSSTMVKPSSLPLLLLSILLLPECMDIVVGTRIEFRSVASPLFITY